MPYTKAKLESLVATQLENLDAMNDLLKIMKEQNELLHCVNKKLSEELSEVKNKCIVYPTRKRNPVRE
ncbi:MAG TPA: hypothetical protein VNB90_16555 [Cytophagaceae bacterium]|jgi:hemerythrin-like domain-containing protein|nr:hypothetical protein [Cytophagaceae bacterium]